MNAGQHMRGSEENTLKHEDMETENVRHGFLIGYPNDSPGPDINLSNFDI